MHVLRECLNDIYLHSLTTITNDSMTIKRNTYFNKTSIIRLKNYITFNK